MNNWGVLFLVVSWGAIVSLVAFCLQRSFFSENKNSKNSKKRKS
jgi:hypothetical protein